MTYPSFLLMLMSCDFFGMQQTPLDYRSPPLSWSHFNDVKETL